jgi:hypothetical protein
MVVMLINISDYYFHIKDYISGNEILERAEKYCAKYDIYNPLIELFIHKLIVADHQDDKEKINIYTKKISLMINLIDSSDKIYYLFKRYEKIMCKLNVRKTV